MIRAALLLLLLAGCRPAPAPVAPDLPTDAISAAAEAHRQAQRLVGLGLGVVHEGRVAYLGGFGWADRERKEAFNPQRSRVRWASISKSLTGSVAARLWERGELDLDSPVSALVPSFQPPAALFEDGTRRPLPAPPRPTLRQLLNHSAGVQGYGDGAVNPTPDEDELHDPAVNTGFAWALERWMTAPLVAEPGAEFIYSTMGHNLAGAAIGAAVAKPGEAVDAAFLRAVSESLQGSGAEGVQPDRHLEPASNRAQGYVLRDDMSVGISHDADVSWKAPGGGFLSTVQELAAFCAHLAGDGLVGQRGKAELWKQPVLADGSTSYYGLGFGVGGRDDRRRVEHNGGQEKARTRLVLYPDEKLCIVAMTNTETGSNRFPIDLTPLTEQVEDLIRASVGM